MSLRGINMEEGAKVSRKSQTCCWLKVLLVESLGRNCRPFTGARGGESWMEKGRRRWIPEPKVAQRSWRVTVAEATLSRNKGGQEKEPSGTLCDNVSAIVSVTQGWLSSTVLPWPCTAAGDVTHHAGTPQHSHHPAQLIKD